MISCTTFPFFPSLPTEIRLRIWTLNLPGTRIVSLQYTPQSSDLSDPATQKHLRGCTSAAPIPINLQINKESREHAKKHYRLSFNLPHCSPKIWFDAQLDVLHFPAKEGWLGSWNHFLNAVTLMETGEVGRVKRLAVSEALFKGVEGASSSPNVRATCAMEFWEYVRRKFGSVEEVVILIEGPRIGGESDDAKTWIEDVLGCVLGSNDGVLVGTGEKRLVQALERGLKLMEEESGWKAPCWDILRYPEDGHEGAAEGWPKASLASKSCELREEREAAVERIVIPRKKAAAKEKRGFWMGGELPFWHYLAS